MLSDHSINLENVRMYSPSDLPYKLASLTIFGTEVPPEGGNEVVCKTIDMRYEYWQKDYHDGHTKRQLGVAFGFIYTGNVLPIDRKTRAMHLWSDDIIE